MKNKKFFLVLSIFALLSFSVACNSNKKGVNTTVNETTSNNTVSNMYKTVDEWKAIYKVPEYVENKEIVGDYNKDLAVKMVFL